MTRIISKLEDIDFKELGANLQATLKGVNRTVNSPEIESVLRSLARVMPKVDQAVVNIRNLAGTTEDKVKILADDLAAYVRRRSSRLETSRGRAQADAGNHETGRGSGG